MSVHPNIRAFASPSQRPKDLSNGLGGDELRLQDHDLLRLGSFEGSRLYVSLISWEWRKGRRR
jgi:hypothetical protein